MKKKFSKEVKIGIAFIFSIFVLYFGINFLKGVNIFKPTNSYLVIFDDVTELSLSAPVSINGFQIGLVHSMELDSDNRVVVTLNLDKGVRIPKGSKVNLEASLLGNAAVTISENPIKTDFYSSSDTIYGHKTKGLMDTGAELIPQVSALLPKLDSILLNLQILTANPALAKSLENVELITSNLVQTTNGVNSMMKSDFPVMLKNVKTITSDVSHTTSQLRGLDIAGTYNSLDSTMKNVNHLSSKLTEKNNSFGLLLNDRQLYDSLSMTIGNASLLLRDVKENPQRYVNIKVF